LWKSEGFFCCDGGGRRRSAWMTRRPAPPWNARGSRSWIPLPRNDSHGGGPPPPASSVGAGAVPAVRCAYPPLLLAVHLYPDSMTPAPTPTDFSAPKFTNFRFFCRADGMARCWREPPRRKLVTCRQGAFEEGNAGEATVDHKIKIRQVLV